MNGKPWTEAQFELLRVLYPRTGLRDLMKTFGRSKISIYGAANKLGIKKDPDFVLEMNRELGRRMAALDIGNRFVKGQVPPNKGLRRPGWAPGRMRETQFKKGIVPVNKMEIGDLRIDSEGFVSIKTNEGKGGYAWEYFHRWLWAQERGPIPPKHFLRFKDGDRLNIDLDNLELISLAENCRRNSIHRLPPALKQSIQLLGALKRTINRRTKDVEKHRTTA